MFLEKLLFAFDKIFFAFADNKDPLIRLHSPAKRRVSDQGRVRNKVRGSYMSVHVLLNLLNELRKKIKCEAIRAYYVFFAMGLINSIIQEHNLFIT